MLTGDLQSDTLSLASTLGDGLLSRGWRIATAESCTGGGVSAAVTAIPGSSQWFEYGIVAYANAAKQHLLNVSENNLAMDSAVSETVILQMIDGILALSSANIAVAVSGIAGPGGGGVDKPVGTVWFAWGLATGERKTLCRHFKGGRREVQAYAVIEALQGVLAFLDQPIKKPE